MDQAQSRAVVASSKGDARRRQIIEAAAECFRQEGFHGASIARISKRASMSPGHIYHYFPNKEQIVEAIVEEEESELAELIRTLDQQGRHGDFPALICAQIDTMIERSLRPQQLSLMLEIAAEAARNPRIAQVLQESDRRVANRLAEMARELGGMSAACLETDAALRARLELLPVLFSGLALRSIHNKDLDLARTAHLIKDILRHIWSERP